MLAYQQAEEFWYKWNKNRSNVEEYKHIRCSDETKGLERVGRLVKKNVFIPIKVFLCDLNNRILL